MPLDPSPTDRSYFIDSDPSLSRKVDAIRQALSVHQIRCVSEQKRDRLRDLNLRDTRERLRVAFADFLPMDVELPSDAFLDRHAVRIYDAILGTTREPRKVAK